MTATLPTAPPAVVPGGARALRDYQIEAADAVFQGWLDGVQGPAVVLPTGSGKSTVIAELTRREVAAGGRVLLMAHRNELIEQMADAALAVNPTGPVPTLIGGPHRGDPSAQIVSATVQSLQRQAALDALGHRDLLIIDEAHHAVARTYLRVIDHFTALGTRRAGFTATMTRLAPAKDEPTLRSVWGDVVYEKDINWAIENGFLLPPHGVTVTLPELDLVTLLDGFGEITDDEATDAMMNEATLNATVRAIVDHSMGLSTIAFGASMPHCRAVAEALVANGVTAEVVVGPTTSRDRRAIYRRFRSGQTQVLVTVDVLTEGADFPCCEVVVLARPTRSQSRLVQCVGRGLRPHTYDDGRVKTRALVIDLVGAGQMGLIVDTELDKKHRACECELPCFGPCTGKKCTGEDCDCLCSCGWGCRCEQPCVGPCGEDSRCTGLDCECACSCGGAGSNTKVSPPCLCSCTVTVFDICRCGCGCDKHRVEPLEDFDPVTGELLIRPGHRTESAWSARTDTIRWARHPRGLVRSIYRSNGSKGVLMLADMRGVHGVATGLGWAFGFYDTQVRRLFWVDPTGNWAEPPCHLLGMSVRAADELAQKIFGGHMRDPERRATPSDSQIDFATRLGIPDAARLNRRDLSDMIALAHADQCLPTFVRPAGVFSGTAA